jgi:hypothetical protein
MTTSRLDFTRTLKPSGALEFVSRPRQDLTGELNATAPRPRAALSADVIYCGEASVSVSASAELHGSVMITGVMEVVSDPAIWVADAEYDINVARGPAASTDDSWQQRAAAVVVDAQSTWQRSGTQQVEQGAAWSQAAAVQASAASVLQGMERKAVTTTIDYQQGASVAASSASSFSILARLQDECSIVYEQGHERSTAMVSGYRYPPRLAQQVDERWQVGASITVSLQPAAWGKGIQVTASHQSLYEQGRQPLPGGSERPEPPVTPEIAISALLAFGRPYRAGGHLEFYWSQTAKHTIPTRRVYFVTNQVQFVRASDGFPIPATSIAVDGDGDSWAWQFTASLPRIRDAESLEGEEVIITINGHEWRCIVDGWSDNRSWGQQSATVTGRSLSAELSSSLYLPRSYTESNTRTLIQLAEQELPDGWVLDWKADDWVVPGGLWSYSSLAPIAVIQQIAEAAGAFILPCMNARRLTVLSKYAVKPWELMTRDADISIPESIMITLGRQRARGQSADGVWISGGNGFAGHVKRSGTAGGNTLSDVSHNLIVDPTGAGALGTALLAKSLSRSTDSIEMPINADTGLILPGQMIQTPSGRGYSRGLRASASVSNDRKLTVRQAIEIERPLVEEV